MRNHKKLLQFLRPDPAVAAARSSSSDDDDDDRCSSLPSPPTTSTGTSAAASPSPYMPSPWVNLPGLGSAAAAGTTDATGLLGSLVKEDGHVYSLAASGDLLYTGTDSRNVRVWRDRREFAGFKCGSGLVKAIVVAGDGRIYTGHQDGKVRVWRASDDDEHKRVGTLPRLGEYLRSSVRPSHYVETGRRKRSSVWLRHFDAVSCLSVDADAGLLYSGSWDRTFKVWRVSDSRCLESVRAHDDAVNTVAAADFDALGVRGRDRQGVAAGGREARRHEARHRAGTPQGRQRGDRDRRGGGGARGVRCLVRRGRHTLAVASRSRPGERAEERWRAARAQDGRAVPRGGRARRRERVSRPDDLRVAPRRGRRALPPGRADRPHGPGQVRGHGRGGVPGRGRTPPVGGVQRQPRRVRQGVARLRRAGRDDGAHAGARVEGHAVVAVGAWNTPYRASERS